MAFSNEYIGSLFVRYKGRGILIDANLLLLYFVGMYDPRMILSFKRTRVFVPEDFDLLLRFFSYFGKVVTTPNILTEVNGFSNHLPENIKPQYYSEFGKQISVLEEEYTASAKICSLDHFSKFGLTDSGIIDLVRGKYLVLTQDFKLANYLQNAGIDAINFNHIRTLNWNN